MLVWFYRICKDKSWGIDAVLVGFGNGGKHLYPLGAHI